MWGGSSRDISRSDGKEGERCEEGFCLNDGVDDDDGVDGGRDVVVVLRNKT